MSILIKGAKMPRFCAECALKYTCEESNLLLGNKRRATDCPLVEIPPHGRLIDADETKRVIGDYFEKIKVACRYAESLVDNAIPTVIESEEQEHG